MNTTMSSMLEIARSVLREPQDSAEEAARILIEVNWEFEFHTID